MSKDKDEEDTSITKCGSLFGAEWRLAGAASVGPSIIQPHESDLQLLV